MIRTNILIYHEAEMIAPWVRRAAFELMLHRLLEPQEPVWEFLREKPKQIQHGPQRNTRKGKQKRW